VTGIALAGSFLVYAQGQVPPTGRPAGGPTGQPISQPSAPAARGTTVAVIDIKHIFENYIPFKNAMDDIKKDYDAFETQVRGLEANLRKDIERLKGMPPGTNEYKALEQQVATTRTQVQLDINNRQKERVEEEAKVYHRANQELVAAVQQFAHRYGIDLVLQYSSAEIDPSKPDTVIRGLNRMVVYHNGLQITDQILQELNRGHTSPPQSVPVQNAGRTPVKGATPNGGGIPNPGFPKQR
jgi:outer membrane protein